MLLTVDERSARYPVTIDPLVRQAYLKASNPEISDTFGWSVGASGDTVVVGAPNEDSGATGVNGDQRRQQPVLFRCRVRLRAGWHELESAGVPEGLQHRSR